MVNETDDSRALSLSYTMTPHDWIEFNVWHHDHSPTTRTSRRGMAWGGGAILIGFGALFVWLQSHVLGIGMMVFGVLWIATCPGQARRSLRQQVRRMIAEGRVPMMEGPNSLSITEEGLRERSNGVDTLRAYGNMQRIVRTPDLVLIYQSAVMAIVIPLRRIERGDAEEFVAELERRTALTAVDGTS